MTADRRQAFAQAASARFDVGEALMQPAVKKAIGMLLAQMQAGLKKHTATRHLTAAGPAAPSPDDDTGDDSDDDTAGFSDDDVDDMLAAMQDSADWAAIMAKTITPAYNSLLDTILGPGLASPDLAKSLMQWRNDWLKSRTQVLVGIPDQVTGQFRTALTDLAAKNGTSVDDARELAQGMLDDGYPSWDSRAQTIARTETVGANNQGALASWSALADQNGVTATKTWLATDDSRTRDSHVDIDGTTVGISESFDVGGSTMNGPGDPEGDPGEVINCRCTMTYDFPDGTEQQADDSGDDGSGDVGDDGDTDALSDVGGLDDLPTVNSGLTAAVVPAQQTGVAVMLGLGAGDEAAILGADGVPDVEAPGLHCTMAYLSEPAASYTPEQQQSLISALAPLIPQITAMAFATAQFNPNDPEREPCAVLLVQSDGLAQLHEQVQQAVSAAGLEQATTFPIWIPHVAIGYNIDTSVIPPSAVGSELQFNRLVLGWAGEQIVVAGDGAQPPPDPAAQTEPDNVTAAVEAEVTAPAVPPPAPPALAVPGATTPAPANDGSATGGDTGVIDLTPGPLTWSGPIAMLDTPTSDGRQMASGGSTIRPLPLSLSWQESTDIGHDGSVVVGRILSVEDRGNMLWGTGDWLDPMINFNSQQAMALVDAGLGTISLDCIPLTMTIGDATGAPIDPALYNGDGDIVEIALTYEVGGATLVSMPAFAEARITNDPPTVGAAETPSLEAPFMDGDFAGATPEAPTLGADGVSVDMPDGSNVKVGDPVGYAGADGSTLMGTLSGIDTTGNTVSVTPPAGDDGTQPPDLTVDLGQLTSAAPTTPAKGDGTGDTQTPADSTASLIASAAARPYQRDFFNQRKLPGVTPITINRETGQVYGHCAQWPTANDPACHVGKLAETGKCVTAPRQPNNDFNRSFHLTPIPTTAGRIGVGKLTLGTGHYSGRGGFRGAMEHYDNTGAQVAVVRAYEDDYGIQIDGQLVNGIDELAIEALERSPLSGDWRQLQPGGPLELVAALAVNVPGFPLRPVFGMEDGEQVSLVAAGFVSPRNVIGSQIVLSSGNIIEREDFEALVAAVVASQRPAGGRDELAERRAAQEEQELRMRLAFSGRLGIG